MVREYSYATRAYQNLHLSKIFASNGDRVESWFHTICSNKLFLKCFVGGAFPNK